MLPDEPLPHPWDEVVDDLPVGKIRHVQSIQRILDFLDRPGRWYGRDVVAPLLSQPVVELCLSIPGWQWVAGGSDRAVARQAFASRSEEHTSELQSLMRISYAVFCLKKNNVKTN